MQRAPIRFHRGYFLAFSGVLALEVCIALFFDDRFIRPFAGDALIVVLMFTFIRTFYAGGKNFTLAAGLFLFACLVELGQYFDLLARLNLHDVAIARLLLGAVFDCKDILAYALGAVLALAAGRALTKSDR